MKTILITGASSGLGRELARVFAREGGHTLVITARRQDRLVALKQELEEKFPVRVHWVAADLADPHAPLAIAQFIKANKLAVDVLINNAGFGWLGEFLKSDFKNVEKMFRVNVLAAMQISQLLLPEMIKRKSGHIVNISSIAAFFPGPLMAAYFATKAGLASFTKALEVELKDSGVKVSLVCPGPFQAEFQAVAFDLKKEENIPSAQAAAAKVARGILRKDRLVIPFWKYRAMYGLRYFFEGLWARVIYGFHKKYIY